MSVSSESSRDQEVEAVFSIPPFAARCREAATQAWQASFEHPFVTALMDGSLDTSRFRFYQMQDARYLEAYADACSLISVRYDDPDAKMWFIEGARLAIVVERQLHEEYGRQLGYGPQDIAALTLTPNNRAYQNHLIASVQTGSLLQAVSALAPCPWLYADIGRYVEESTGFTPDEHPYSEWLKTYCDPAFVVYTNELLVHLQKLSDSHRDEELHDRAVEAFVISARYEFMFWEQAWNMQDWPVDAASDAVTDVEDNG